MNFEPQILLLWGNLFLSLAAVAGHIKNWMSSGEKRLAEEQKKLSDTIARHESKLTDHDRRIQSIEGDMKHLPNRDTAHQLALAMAEISGRLNSMEAQIEGRLNAMDERLKPISSTTLRLQEFLLENAK